MNHQGVALNERIRTILENMISASKYRLGVATDALINQENGQLEK